MARKNLLEGLGALEVEQSKLAPTSYPVRGASKSMIRSIDELARQADKFLEGEQVVEIDPDAIDGSFIADRMGDDQEQYQDLVEAIRDRGQDTPVLVRPHPEQDGRFMVVFGHRRVRVARQLGRKVRAVVKAIDDKTHVIAQGQENSARANLTFIERATFAKRLEDLGYEREVISSALAANAAAVSKMISVTTRIPTAMIQKIGAAPAIGRERWVELSLLIAKPSNTDKANALTTDIAFIELGSSDRFERLFAGLNSKGQPVRKTSQKIEAKSWALADKSVRVSTKGGGKLFTLALKAKDAPQFGSFLSDRLEQIYAEFRELDGNQGD